MPYLTQKTFHKIELIPEQSKIDSHQVVLESSKVIQLECADHHSMCLTKKGEVFVWGGHSKGKRGDDPDKRPTRKDDANSVMFHIPCRIQALSGKKIV